MNDIYKTPESSLEDGKINAGYDFELYTISAIGLATFFGTVFAGGLILAINFKRLGKESEARKTLLFSAIALAVVFLIAFQIPEDVNVPNIIFTIIQLVAMIQIAKKLQAADINHHIDNGGWVASNWKAFGISLLVLTGVMAILFLVVMMFMS